MLWSEIFLVLLVCHCTGDFLLQTEFQATSKHGGLGRDPVRRHALFSHVATYAIPFVPAVIWMTSVASTVLSLLVLFVVLATHLVQDDGRLLVAYVHKVKRTTAPFGSPLWIAIDQSAHILVLFGAAILATA